MVQQQQQQQKQQQQPQQHTGGYIEEQVIPASTSLTSGFVLSQQNRVKKQFCFLSLTLETRWKSTIPLRLHFFFVTVGDMLIL